MARFSRPGLGLDEFKLFRSFLSPSFYTIVSAASGTCPSTSVTYNWLGLRFRTSDVAVSPQTPASSTVGGSFTYDPGAEHLVTSGTEFKVGDENSSAGSYTYDAHNSSTCSDASVRVAGTGTASLDKMGLVMFGENNGFWFGAGGNPRIHIFAPRTSVSMSGLAGHVLTGLWTRYVNRTTQTQKEIYAIPDVLGTTFVLYEAGSETDPTARSQIGTLDCTVTNSPETGFCRGSLAVDGVAGSAVCLPVLANGDNSENTLACVASYSGGGSFVSLLLNSPRVTRLSVSTTTVEASEINTQATSFVTLTNLSGRPIPSLGTPTFASNSSTSTANFSIISNSCPATLNGYESCQMTLAFISSTYETIADTIRVSYSDGSGASPNATALVAGASGLVSIAVTPANPTFGIGDTTSFTATATYLDNSTQDISTVAQWTSSDAGVVTVDASGAGTMLDLGDSTVSAEFGSKEGTTSVTVNFGTKRIGGLGDISSGYAYVAAMITDSSGNIYVTGRTSADLHGELISVVGEDQFLVKYNSSFQRQWTVLYSNGYMITPSGISIDSFGNVVICAYYNDGGGWSTQLTKYSGNTLVDSASFSGFATGLTTDGSDNLWIVGSGTIWEYDSNLDYVQDFNWGGGPTSAHGIAWDGSAYLYVVGTTSENLGDQVNVASTSAFVAKFDTSLEAVWYRLLGDSATQNGFGVRAGAGGVWISGTTFGGVGGLSMIGWQDAFAAHYAADGTLQWIGSYGESGGGIGGPGALNYNGQFLAVDGSGNAYVAASTTAGLGGASLVGLGDYALIKFSDGGSVAWAKNGGASNGVAQGWGVAVDPSGNPYVAGSVWNGSMDSQLRWGSSDGFVVKYNSSGVRQSTLQLGPGNGQASSRIVSSCTDGSGNIYALAGSDGALPDQFHGLQGAVLRKFNSQGVLQWTAQEVSTGEIGPSAVACDSSGNTFITGNFSGSLDGNSALAGTDYFLMKYNSSGVRQWTVTGNEATTLSGTGVALDSSGKIYVTGYTYGDLHGESATGFPDYFLIQFDASGGRQWTRLHGSSSVPSISTGLEIDGSDRISVVGYTYGDLFGSRIGNVDGFVSRFTTEGVRSWTAQIGVASADTQFFGIDSDSSGKVYVAGQTNGALNGITLVGNPDAVIVRIATDGSVDWSVNRGTASGSTLTRGFGVSVDGSDVYLAGITSGDLDGQTVSSSEAPFLAKYTGSTWQWTRVPTTTGNSSGNAVGLAASGYPLLLGEFAGTLNGIATIGLRDGFILKYDSNGDLQ